MLGRALAEIDRRLAAAGLPGPDRSPPLGRPGAGPDLLARWPVHHFNNLLTVIGGQAELAASSVPADSELQESLTEIRVAAGRAAELCRRMGDAAGHSFAPRCEIGPRALLADSIDLLPSGAGRCSLECQMATADHLRMHGVAPQLQRALAALVQNAFEAVGSDQGLVRVVVRSLLLGEDEAGRLEVRPRPGLHVCFDVSDTGGGVSPEVRVHMFEPFFTTKEPGRGLGLAAAAGVVRAHGGGLGVLQSTGRGTTIRLALPAVAVADGPQR